MAKPALLTLEVSPGAFAPDRHALRTELVALFEQYNADAEFAMTEKEEYSRRLVAAETAHEAACQRMDMIRNLLDLEFPGWDDRYQ